VDEQVLVPVPADVNVVVDRHGHEHLHVFALRRCAVQLASHLLDSWPGRPRDPKRRASAPRRRTVAHSFRAPPVRAVMGAPAAQPEHVRNERRSCL